MEQDGKLRWLASSVPKARAVRGEIFVMRRAKTLQRWCGIHAECNSSGIGQARANQNRAVIGEADKALVKSNVPKRWSAVNSPQSMSSPRRKGWNTSYVAHVLRLALLAPDIVEAILDGCQPRTMQLQPLLRKEFPVLWEQQRTFFAQCAA